MTPSIRYIARVSDKFFDAPLPYLSLALGKLADRVLTEKNGFVTATKLGTTKIFFVAATKNFAAANKRFVDGT